MAGKLSIADYLRETHIRLRSITDYEAYVNAIDHDYEPKDAVLNGYTYKINFPHFNLVDRSQYGNGSDFKHEIIEY